MLTFYLFLVEGMWRGDMEIAAHSHRRKREGQPLGQLAPTSRPHPLSHHRRQREGQPLGQLAPTSRPHQFSHHDPFGEIK